VLLARVVTVLVLGAGCTSGSTLEFDKLSNPTAFVGSELRVDLVLKTADPHSPLRYTFEANVPALCRDGRCRAGFERNDKGATFRWVPRVEDVGTWDFRFHVTDGTSEYAQAVRIEVRSSIGYEGLPRFVQPLGTGTTLDLSRDDCFAFDIVIDDPDSRGVQIREVPPFIEGAELEVHDEFSATWRWCPGPDRMRAGAHRRLVLAADDGTSEADKEFLLVMRRPAKPECDAAAAPVIEHRPSEWTSVGDVAIVAHVTAPDGLKHAPLLYYSATDPGETPSFGRMTQLTMERASGDSTDGVWEARIPNPSTRLPAGTATNLYYVLSATSASADGAPCDLHADAPKTGAYKIQVVSPGPTAPPEEDTLGPCDRCTSDVQCGEEGDLCVAMGTRGDQYCLAACATDADCASGYTCGSTEVRSVDGTRARQCVPATGTCQADTETSCADDSFEDNDTQAAVTMSGTPLPAGDHMAVSCAGAAADEDWYRIVLPAEGQVRATVRGDSTTDLDLALVSETGTVLAISESLRSTEEVVDCLPAGTYFLRVYAFGDGRNPYTVEWSSRAGACAGVCRPDDHEPNDDARTATRVGSTRELRTSGSICSGNDDWYAIELRAGEMVGVELTFIHAEPSDDLDLHFLDASLTDWTPCTEADPSTCWALQGQSLDSNEYWEALVEEDGTYYVMVHGFDGAENDYDIRIWVM
jgi:hypothetical protein